MNWTTSLSKYSMNFVGLALVAAVVVLLPVGCTTESDTATTVPEVETETPAPAEPTQEETTTEAVEETTEEEPAPVEEEAAPVEGKAAPVEEAAEPVEEVAEPTQGESKEAASDELPDNAGAMGELKIRFVYGGDEKAYSDGDDSKTAPSFEPRKEKITADPEFCGKFDIRSEKLLVNPKNKGIKNVVVYVYTGRGGSDLPDYPNAGKTHTLANKNCRFEPHVVICQTGDTLKVTNPDAVGHNANLAFFNNKAQNPTIPASQEKSFLLEESEPAPIPVTCNIHPWMNARIVVLDHPFAAASDEDGNLSIKGLPTGEKLAFRVNHEAGSIRSVEIDGEEVEWSRSVFEVEIKPGANDLGTVVLSAEALKAN